MSALDQCTTAAGKRLLSQWLCRPLLRIADICARQDAVQALMAADCAEAVGAARKALAGSSDSSLCTCLHCNKVLHLSFSCKPFTVCPAHLSGLEAAGLKLSYW